ncbi:hypothetical protein M0804_004196 [Polistes exclamans]|nr:hypothetical protein M0804_004196 [Polistes exclamans]
MQDSSSNLFDRTAASPNSPKGTPPFSPHFDPYESSAFGKHLVITEITTPFLDWYFRLISDRKSGLKDREEGVRQKHDAFLNDQRCRILVVEEIKVNSLVDFKIAPAVTWLLTARTDFRHVQYSKKRLKRDKKTFSEEWAGELGEEKGRGGGGMGLERGDIVCYNSVAQILRTSLAATTAAAAYERN